ncbi:MAG: metallophosphoesterase [Clostridia bacterium]|nr:metallophosphoesterase [Clostridia bacterium]
MTRPHLPPGKAVRYNYNIVCKNLPESFSGFKIAHISDLHSRPAKGICEIIKGACPDIITITGDLLNDDNKSTGEVDALISELLKIAPVYFISGNHDLWRMGYKRIFDKYQELGAVFMDKKTVAIERNGEKIGISGCPDPFSKIPQAITENVQKNLEKLEKIDGFNILLFHRANLFDMVKDAGVDLVLSGHMHGGQVRIPGIGGVLAPSSSMLSGTRMLFPKYTGGVVTSDDTTMIINRGVSNTLPIPRLGNPPEVGIITLLNK